MQPIPGCTHVWSVGAAHPDRELFDCLMPLPFGTTYNSYLLRGEEKTVLIDPVDPEKTDVLMDHLRQAEVTRVDYVVCLHTEQDHSGSIHALLKKWPDARVVVSAKVHDLMMTHVHLADEAMDVVTEEDVLDLGGRTLRFYMIPFAHWPDNTMAYCPEEDILFSSDLFGAHYAAEQDAQPSDDVRMTTARSYYSEIMMPFATQIAKHTARVQELNPAQIAPSHGPVWQKPEQILSAYANVGFQHGMPQSDDPLSEHARQHERDGQTPDGYAARPWCGCFAARHRQHAGKPCGWDRSHDLRSGGLCGHDPGNPYRSGRTASGCGVCGGYRGSHASGDPPVWSDRIVRMGLPHSGNH